MSRTNKNESEKLKKAIETYEKWGKSYFWKPIKGFDYTKENCNIDIVFNDVYIKINVEVYASSKNIYVTRNCEINNKKCTIRKIKNLLGGF